jgi:hypothetical protein
VLWLWISLYTRFKTKLSVSLIKEYKQLCHFSNVFLCRFFFNNKGDYSINRVRVQVVACSKAYLHITVMLSKAYGPESQLPLPALGGGLWWYDPFLLWKYREFVRSGSANDYRYGKTSYPLWISRVRCINLLRATESRSAIYCTRDQKNANKYLKNANVSHFEQKKISILTAKVFKGKRRACIHYNCFNFESGSKFQRFTDLKKMLGTPWLWIHID